MTYLTYLTAADSRLLLLYFFICLQQHTLFQKYNDYKDTQVLTKEACIKH